VPEPCDPDCELRWSQWSAARFDASHPIAAELDIFAGARNGTKLLPPEGACEGGEDKAFRSMCASTIEWMQRHNNETRGRRALFFEYRGDKNALGWGHTLTVAYALHGICRLLRRFCYVSLYDMDLGTFHGYADGSSWAKPGPTELAQYHSVSTVQAAESVTFSRQGLAGLLSQLRNRKYAQASLIHVVQKPPLYLEVGGDAWFPRQMPRCMHRQPRSATLPRHWIAAFADMSRSHASPRQPGALASMLRIIYAQASQIRRRRHSFRGYEGRRSVRRRRSVQHTRPGNVCEAPMLHAGCTLRAALPVLPH